MKNFTVTFQSIDKTKKHNEVKEYGFDNIIDAHAFYEHIVNIGYDLDPNQYKKFTASISYNKNKDTHCQIGMTVYDFDMYISSIDEITKKEILE